MSVKHSREKGGSGDGGGDRNRNMFVAVICNCAAELKLLLTVGLLLFSIITIFQFIPTHFTITNFRDCFPKPSSVSLSTNFSVSNRTAKSPSAAPATAESVTTGVVKRNFRGFGSAAYNFVFMSAYRGGYNTFAVMGLASKPLHVYGNPSYVCEWIAADKSDSVTVSGEKILPDWGYGRVYTTVVINCTFPVPVGDSNSGGKLLLHAASNGGGDTNLYTTNTFTALTETPQEFSNFTSLFLSNPKFDNLYCGSSLYGDLSPQRIREWLAYHAKLFGESSHFVFYDAGGVHAEVMAVLRPWIERGYVTLQDIKEQERFDGYYHNQFLIVNDCLHRYKFLAKWMFFFDVDEFIFVPKKRTLKSVLDSLSDFTQFTFEQKPMSNQLCFLEDYGKLSRRWGFEKMVYRDKKRGIRRDRKYAVQPRNVAATGVHLSQNVFGNTTHRTEGRIMYYHYHGSVALRHEPCRRLLNATSLAIDKIPYILDTTMRGVAGIVKRFELKTIGPVLQNTRQ